MNALGHAAVGCASAAASGGSCQAGAMSAGFSAGFGNYFPEYGNHLAVQMVVGGTASVLGGGKFANGAQTAAMGYIFNWLAHIGFKVNAPMVGGASFGFGLSKMNGIWDAGVIIDSDILVVNAGKMMTKTALEFGIQKGDFLDNKGDQGLNIEAGYKYFGASIQKGSDGSVTGISASIGPQLGVAVSGQQTRTISFRYDVLPSVTRGVEKFRSWLGF